MCAVLLLPQWAVPMMRCIHCKRPAKPGQEICQCGDRLISKSKIEKDGANK